MVNQICIAATLQGVAEAMRFGLNAELDMERVLGVIAGGAAQSWQLENRGPWMLDQRYKEGGFTVDLVKKDLALCLEQAAESGTSLPVTDMVNGFFAALQDTGQGGWDFSSLFELL
jgi:3-hydroxyisobutyrate dehydrogenase-like beta-hydroxyacid dehydrogenase